MAGDHKCPLCPATFTRPQHVGRHLRAHTGDRPYECKECPLRFARSDLLSRHVNKAHRAPEEGAENKKDGKKGRRKSFPSLTKPSTSFQALDNTRLPGDAQVSPQQPPAMAREKPRAASFDHPPLQAERMYPNHPLLVGNPLSANWDMTNFNDMSRSPIPQTYPNPAYAGMANPYAGPSYQSAIPIPMRPTGSDQGLGSSAMGRNSSGLSGMSFDLGYKKRACDQCNHSKVRCDFADPCARCIHRNVSCTYHKPPKSRSIGMTPASLANPSPGGSTTILGTSTSPASHYSSPHSITSPNVPMSAQSVSSTPIHMNSTLPLGAQQIPMQNWANMQSMSQPWPGGMSVPYAYDTYGLDPTTVAPQYTPVLNSAIIHASPATTHVPLTASNTMPPPSTIPTQSPPQTLAVTPSLTSHTTSPSSTDELSEHRLSQSSILTENVALYDKTAPAHGPRKSITPDDNNPAPHHSPNKMAAPSSAYPFRPDLSGASYVWPQTTIDPRTQFGSGQTGLADGVSASNAPTTYEQDGNGPSAVQHRRRSSAGVWASAFNQMTLQDGSTEGLPVPDPFTAVQVAQQTAQRPSFPTFTATDGTEKTRIPSLSDVKDLWKLFMAEPMTGPLQGVPKEGEGQAQPPLNLFAPRPTIGNRTLSKSNSMPDLQSPLLYGQSQPFAEMGTASGRIMTPKPFDQMSMAATGKDDNVLSDWRNEIQHRQASFTMQPGGKLGRSGTSISPTMRVATTNPALSSEPSSTMHAMLPPNYPHRPIASVVQHSGALQQTLAPERIPSFGLTPGMEQSYIPGTYSVPNSASPTKSSFPQHTQQGFQRTASKLAAGQAQTAHASPVFQYSTTYNNAMSASSSHLNAHPSSQPQAQPSMPTLLARPGNKRLPSQTLGPDTQKRSTFAVWDGEEDEADGGYEGEAEAGGIGAYGSGMVQPGAMGRTDFSIPSSRRKGSMSQQQRPSARMNSARRASLAVPGEITGQMTGPGSYNFNHAAGLEAWAQPGGPGMGSIPAQPTVHGYGWTVEDGTGS